jgi:hypothetical protein
VPCSYCLIAATFTLTFSAIFSGDQFSTTGHSDLFSY